MNIKNLDIKHRNQLLFDAHNDRRQKLLGYPDIPDEVVVRESQVERIFRWVVPFIIPGLMIVHMSFNGFDWVVFTISIVVFVLYLFSVQPSKHKEHNVVLDLEGIQLKEEKIMWSRVQQLERINAMVNKGWKNDINAVLITYDEQEVVLFSRVYNYKQNELDYLLWMFLQRARETTTV